MATVPAVERSEPCSLQAIHVDAMVCCAKSINTTTVYLHLTQKKLSTLQSPFDLLRLPKEEEGPTPPPPPPAPQS